MVCALIWSLWDGRTGYRRSPSQLVGPVWLLGRPLEPGLLGRGRESASGLRWYPVGGFGDFGDLCRLLVACTDGA